MKLLNKIYRQGSLSSTNVIKCVRMWKFRGRQNITSDHWSLVGKKDTKQSIQYNVVCLKEEECEGTLCVDCLPWTVDHDAWVEP